MYQKWSYRSTCTETVQWLSDRLLDLRPKVRASPPSLCCGPRARHIHPSLVLVQPRKTHPYIIERLLKGCRESTNKTNYIWVNYAVVIQVTKLCSNPLNVSSVVECLAQDRRAASSSLTGVTVLWSLSKTHLS